MYHHCTITVEGLLGAGEAEHHIKEIIPRYSDGTFCWVNPTDTHTTGIVNATLYTIQWYSGTERFGSGEGLRPPRGRSMDRYAASTTERHATQHIT